MATTQTYQFRTFATAPAVYVAVTLSVIVPAGAFFRWELPGVFEQLVLGLVLAIAFFASLIISLASLFFATKRLAGTIGLCINLLTILILLVVPFTELWLTFDFRRHLADRQHIVGLIQAGELKPVQGNYIQLPASYSNLSKSRVIVDSARGLVFFSTFYGPTDNFAGFVFVPNESEIDELRALSGHPIFYGPIEVTKFAPNWFFVANT